MAGNRAADWLAQANNDLAFAKLALASGFYSQCCFVSQQCAEKVLKAALFARGNKAVFTHSLFQLCQVLGINGELEVSSKKLDTYYVSARYPDALPGGAPFEIFAKEDALEALGHAERLVNAASDLMRAG